MSEFEDKLKEKAGSELEQREKDLNDRVGVGQDDNQGQSQSTDSPQEPQAPTTPGASGS